MADELARGWVTATGGNYIIDLFSRTDMSTILHEMGHVFFIEMERAVNNGYADADMTSDFNTLREWVGGVPSRYSRGWP